MSNIWSSENGFIFKRSNQLEHFYLQSKFMKYFGLNIHANIKFSSHKKAYFPCTHVIKVTVPAASLCRFLIQI